MGTVASYKEADLSYDFHVRCSVESQDIVDRVTIFEDEFHS